jgi:predicted nucleic acid-binding protein
MKKEKLKVYLDTSVYNRPFDDQGQTRIRLEAEAFLLILEKAISGTIRIIASSALEYENSRNPFIERRERVTSYLSVASKFTSLNDIIKRRALTLENMGIDPIDALHLAFAETSADYFLTCDDGILKKTKKTVDLFSIEVCNPLEFILKEVFKNA